MHGSFTMNWSLEDLICYLILLVYSGVTILYMCFFYFVNGQSILGRTILS